MKLKKLLQIKGIELFFNISSRQKRLIFRVRTRMIKVGDNFGNKNEHCPLCLMEKNNQVHILDCIVVKFQCREVFNDTKSVYTDIFSNDIDKMKSVISLIDIALRKRDQLLSN